MTGYFENFPIMAYNGVTVVNIFRRGIIPDKYKNNYALFEDYTIKDGERADILADRFYGSPYYVWILYIFNNIIDPNDWPLSNIEFQQYILDTYGSYADASETSYYKCNYAEYPQNINSIEYNNLPAVCKAYWKAILSTGNQVIGYKRKPLSIKLSEDSYDLLDDDIKQYYSEVSYLEDENTINENKRKIKVLKREYVSTLETDLGDALS